MNVDTLGRPNLRQVSQLHRALAAGLVPEPDVVDPVAHRGRLRRHRPWSPWCCGWPTGRPSRPTCDGLALRPRLRALRRQPRCPGRSRLLALRGRRPRPPRGERPQSRPQPRPPGRPALGRGRRADLRWPGPSSGGRFVGLAAGVLVASAPVSWFAGATVSTYSVDALPGRPAGGPGPAGPTRAASTARWPWPPSASGPGSGSRSSPPSVSWPSSPWWRASGPSVISSPRSVAALASVAVWLVPVMVVQPGGLSAWLHAMPRPDLGRRPCRRRSSCAPSAGVVTNLGTFGGWSLVSLGPRLHRGRGGRHRSGRGPAGHRSTGRERQLADLADDGRAPGHRRTAPVPVAPGPSWPSPCSRPWLSSPWAGSPAAGPSCPIWSRPPFSCCSRVGRLLHHRSSRLRRAAVVVGTLLVVLLVAVNVQRFVCCARHPAHERGPAPPPAVDLPVPLPVPLRRHGRHHPGGRRRATGRPPLGRGGGRSAQAGRAELAPTDRGTPSRAIGPG